jgi:hypothetical protein
MDNEAADPTHGRAPLLPQSGIGVVGPWFVIAPAGHPVIRLDVRFLDRVEIRTERDEETDEADEDPEHDRGCEIILACGDLEVAVYVEDGPEGAQHIVNQCAPFTRQVSRERATQPALVASPIERVSRRAEYGKLVVISSTPDAESVSTDGLAGYTYELTRPKMMVGRTNDNDIIIVHRSISREHAKVTRDPITGRYTITDLHACNGLRVNGERCIGVELDSGDIVDLGHVRMRFVAPGEEDFWFAPDTPADAERILFIGGDAVIRRDENIHIGPHIFAIDDVDEYALQGENLPLGGRCRLQAAMAVLVVSATLEDV